MWFQTQPNLEIDGEGVEETHSSGWDKLGCDNMEKGQLGQFTNSWFWWSGVHSAKAFGGTQVENVVSDATKS